MLFYIFVILVFNNVNIVKAYKIPKVQLEVLENGFEISIPDESGIKSVFFVIEINKQCPAIIDLITKQNESSWRTTQARKLLTNDILNVALMVQYNENIFEAAQTINITNNGPNSMYLTSSSNPLTISGRCTAKDNAIDGNTCRKSQTVILEGNVKTKPICQNALIFDEQFRDLKKWKFLTEDAIDEQSFVNFTTRNQNIYVESNNLHIKPEFVMEDIRDRRNKSSSCISCYPTSVLSAKINTANSFTFTNARIEIRAKLPKGDWIFPYIMLEESKSGNQIRIAFVRNIINASESTLYWGLQSAMQSTNYHTCLEDRFHTYTLIWEDECLMLILDGKQNILQKYCNSALKGGEYYLVLGVSAGGSKEFIDIIEKPWCESDPSANLHFYKSFACCSPGENQWREFCEDNARRNICEKKEHKKSVQYKQCSHWNNDAKLIVDYVRVYAV